MSAAGLGSADCSSSLVRRLHLLVNRRNCKWLSWRPLLPLLTLFFLPGLPSARDTPSPIDPESIQVPLSYEPDPADLALSSVPGQEMFDPRKRKFSAEELKPQPMIKKARKVFIPEDMKVRRRPGSGPVRPPPPPFTRF